MNACTSHISTSRQNTNRPPNIWWKHESHTSNAATSAGVIPLCQTKWHSWQRKEQAESRQRVKWPWDVNNLGDWGRPTLINAGQQCWLSGIVLRGTILRFSPMGVLVTPLLPPQSKPPGGLFTPSHASVDPAHDNEDRVCGRRRLTETVPVKCYPANTPSSLLSSHFAATSSMIQRSTFAYSQLGKPMQLSYSCNVLSFMSKIHLYICFTYRQQKREKKVSRLILLQHGRWKWEQDLQPSMTVIQSLIEILMGCLKYVFMES